LDLGGAAGGEMEGGYDKLREGVRRSKSFQSSEDGSSHVRCVVNIAIARK
jgi:hypothetical protein